MGKERMCWNEEWKQIDQSDEKKFILDDLDGWQYCWHDLSKEESSYCRFQQDGCSVMV